MRSLLASTNILPVISMTRAAGHGRRSRRSRMRLHIAAIMEAAFWASLRREEGYVPKISLAFVSPDEADQPLRLRQPLRLDPAALTRVAPAVAPAGIHLGVSRDANGELTVWGTVRALPRLCFVLEVAAPGLLVVKHQRGGVLGKVRQRRGDRRRPNQGHRRTRVDAAGLSAAADVVARVRFAAVVGGFCERAGAARGGDARARPRRVDVMVVPTATQEWRDSIVHPISYETTPPFAELATLAKENPDERRRKLWREALDEAVNAVASLTAVDGATILSASTTCSDSARRLSGRKGRRRSSR